MARLQAPILRPGRSRNLHPGRKPALGAHVRSDARCGRSALGAHVRSDTEDAGWQEGGWQTPSLGTSLRKNI